MLLCIKIKIRQQINTCMENGYRISRIERIRLGQDKQHG